MQQQEAVGRVPLSLLYSAVPSAPDATYGRLLACIVIVIVFSLYCLQAPEVIMRHGLPYDTSSGCLPACIGFPLLCRQAPEVIMRRGTTHAADYRALGYTT
jgi:hypothetical protein